MRTIILAGGLGTRLKERVPDLPKPMAPVGGRPFLEYLLDRLVAAGAPSVVLSVGYRAEAITDHFGHSYRGLPLQYAVEDSPLGTGGALAHALAGPGDEPVMALNGDTLLRVDFPALWAWYAAAPSPLAMVLRNVPDVSRYGAIRTLDGHAVAFEEKGRSGPGLINGGIYLLRPSLFAQLGLSGRFSFETDVLERHCSTLRPRAFVSDDYFVDIGIPSDLDRANNELPGLN